MPRITTTVSSPVAESFRVQQVRGMFSLATEKTSAQSFAAEIPDLTEPWQIGAIVGPSGSGKTTLARRAYGAALASAGDWPRDAAVIDGFGPGSIHDVAQTLIAVGFSSPPAWLRPYHALSNGERFRCDLARALFSGGNADHEQNERLVVFDEFTSVVDRTVAQVGSAAVARAIRAARVRCRFVAVTCHYDVLPWLEPDWVLDLASGELKRGRLRRPHVALEVVRCRPSAWSLFARHHYLNGTPPRVGEFYLAAWRGQPVAFCAVSGLFGQKGRKRISRVVVLPDFQGLGLGTRFAEHVCALQCQSGFRMHLTASHPAIIAHCRRSPRWRTVSVKKLGHGGVQFARGQRFKGSQGRGVASFEYVGTMNDE